MKNLIFGMLLFIAGVSSCKAPPAEDSILEQSMFEEKRITTYIAANKLVAVRHYTGMYYIISDPGVAESVPYYPSTNITAKYTGRLLDGATFSVVTNPSTNPMSSLILAWRVGIPLIHKGGKIRLFVPSALAYGQSGFSTIPGNAILDFDIELVDVQN